MQCPQDFPNCNDYKAATVICKMCKTTMKQLLQRHWTQLGSGVKVGGGGVAVTPRFPR